MDAVGKDVVTEVKKNITQKHIIDTGALLGSISHVPNGEEVTVKDGVSYGVYNEFGTNRMGARPFFLPAVEMFGVIVTRRFTELLK
jgi:hypothetical protein